MNIHTRPDQDLAIQQAIKAGLIKNEIDALDIGLDILRAGLSKNANPNARQSPQEAAENIRELRKGNFLPDGLTIEDFLLENRGRESSGDAINRLANFGKNHNLSLGDYTIKDLINEGRL